MIQPPDSEPVLVLGPKDPEMDAIERYAERKNIPYVHAVSKSGELVEYSNAYSASGVCTPELVGAAGVVMVEADVPSLHDKLVARIDHHRPVDPSYHMPPSQAVQASSLGQFAERYHIALTPEEKAIAAIDHNFVESIRGHVSEVDPLLALQIRIIGIADTHNIDPAEVRHEIEIVAEKLQAIGGTDIAGMETYDISDIDLGSNKSRDKLIVQTASALLGKPVLMRLRNELGGDEKLMLSGADDPIGVQRFMEEWAPSHMLHGVFGVPNRGYAGGFISELSSVRPLRSWSITQK